MSAMDREILKKVIADQRAYSPPKDYFFRTQSETIRTYVTDPSIIIISGIRRSGKSTIMKTLQRELSESDYYINFEDDRLVQFKLSDFQTLLEVFIELFGKQSTFYFDEIQNVEGWETFIRRLHDQNNKIFITGSNARLLSRELGTHLTGRYIPVEVYPLSFKEIVVHKHPEIVFNKFLGTTEIGLGLQSFANYMINGGIPDFVKYAQDEYLRSLYEGILYRDIITRHGITLKKPLKELVYYLASNIGKEISYSNLCKLLSIGSANTISTYCGYLQDSYLCFFVNRYSHSLQKQILYHKKCYFIDPAIIRLIGFRVSEDRGRLLENIAFLKLQTLKYEIFFHKQTKECDFLLRQGNKIIQAIQVTVSLNNPETRERELNGLLEAMKEYNLNKGLILTEAEEETIELIQNENKYFITVIPLWRWLLISDVSDGAKDVNDR